MASMRWWFGRQFERQREKRENRAAGLRGRGGVADLKGRGRRAAVDLRWRRKNRQRFEREREMRSRWDSLSLRERE